jgi:hypothetical protein
MFDPIAISVMQRHFLLLFIVLFGAAIGCCLQQAVAAQARQAPDRVQESSSQPELPPYVERYQRTGLPPLGRQITPGHREGYPPTLSGLRHNELARPEFAARGTRPAAEIRVDARKASLRDARITQVLGKRFAVIGAKEHVRSKGATDPGDNLVWIEFYSYSNNRAVKALLDGDTVVDIQYAADGYQPPDSREEVAAAADVVRQDGRYRRVVDALTVRGIQTPSDNGNRYLFLLFYKQDTRRAVFTATVDMTESRVVEVNAVQ